MDMPTQPDPMPFTSPKEETPAVGGIDRMRFAQWMIFLSLTMLFIPIMLVGRTLTEQMVTTEARITELEAIIEQPPVDPTIEALNAELLAARNTEGELRLITDQLFNEHVAWAALIGVIGRYDIQHIQLTELRHETTGGISIMGYARTESDVIVYERDLETTEQFASVDLRTVEYRPDTNDTPTRFPIYFHMQVVLKEPE
jgi:Tfp pilus assembly protein PilN